LPAKWVLQLRAQPNWSLVINCFPACSDGVEKKKLVILVISRTKKRGGRASSLLYCPYSSVSLSLTVVAVFCFLSSFSFFVSATCGRARLTRFFGETSAPMGKEPLERARVRIFVYPPFGFFSSGNRPPVVLQCF